MKIIPFLILLTSLNSTVVLADPSSIPAPIPPIPTSPVDPSKIVSLPLGDLQILMEAPALHERMTRLDEQAKAINKRLMDQLNEHK